MIDGDGIHFDEPVTCPKCNLAHFDMDVEGKKGEWNMEDAYDYTATLRGGVVLHGGTRMDIKCPACNARLEIALEICPLWFVSIKE